MSARQGLGIEVLASVRDVKLDLSLRHTAGTADTTWACMSDMGRNVFFWAQCIIPA